jgi:extradiol dioxygenase family protein
MNGVIFHVAFPVHDMETAKRFYVEGLGCGLGRESATAVMLELSGHQIVAHRMDSVAGPAQRGIYPRHFGLIFRSEEDWQRLVDRARSKGLTFYKPPSLRFPGTRLEHQSFFLEDPSHNLLEFKHYRYESAIFGERELARVGETEDA